ncbi:hypothetical protein ACOBQJ_07270 [Pelotomaculum propionicicum]|uniref:hypothetical protein n=1 Tax=Pelotomaculum propionicicum TaxID=258475 RepID=UPI003B79489F
MRIFNAVIAGLLTGLLLYFLAALASVKAAFYIFVIGTVLFAFLFYRSSRTIGTIWTKACLVAAVECLVIPLASLILPLFYGQQTVQTAQQGAQAAGEAFGSTLGGGLVNLLTGYTGFLIGILLLAIAYFSVKPARRC